MSALDDNPRRVVALCALASVLWLVAFHVGRLYFTPLVTLVPVAVVVIAVVLRTLPRARARLRVRTADVLWGVAAAGVSVGATYACYPFFADAVPLVRDDARALYGLFPMQAAHVLPVLVVVLAEELLWRGALLMALRRDLNMPLAVALSASLYAAAQLGSGSLILALVALVLGVFWSALAAVTRSLVPGLIAHAVWTPTVLFLVPLDR